MEAMRSRTIHRIVKLNDPLPSEYSYSGYIPPIHSGSNLHTAHDRGSDSMNASRNVYDDIAATLKASNLPTHKAWGDILNAVETAQLAGFFIGTMVIDKIHAKKPLEDLTASQIGVVIGWRLKPTIIRGQQLMLPILVRWGDSPDAEPSVNTFSYNPSELVVFRANNKQEGGSSAPLGNPE